MPMKATRVAVIPAPVRLDDATVAPNVGGSILIKNPIGSTGTVAIGGANVTADTGFELEPGAVVAISAQDWARVYAITSTGTVTVQLLETRA